MTVDHLNLINNALFFSAVSQFHLNLSQLPNFAFSVPLAYYYISQRENLSDIERTQNIERANCLIQNALIVFPSGK